MARTTGQDLVEQILRKMGNLSITTFGIYAVEAFNDAVQDIATGNFVFDFPSLEKTSSFFLPTGASSPQVTALTNWANDIWIPLHWHDLTNDLPIFVANEAVPDLDLDSAGDSTQINRYYLWGEDLLTVPAVSVTTQVQLRYISLASSISFNPTTEVVTGSSPFDRPWDEGIKLATCSRLALIVNPGMENFYQAQLSRWAQRRITQKSGALFGRQHTIWPQT